MTKILAEDFSTACIHSALNNSETTCSLLPPLYQTSTYAQEAVGIDKGYTYSRTANPTVTALEQRLARLENAGYGCCFRTGMAAITSLCLALLKSGDHIICGDVVYGGTVRLFADIFAKFNVGVSYVDSSDPLAIQQAIQKNTKAILIETPANPTLKLTDIEAITHLAQENSLLSIVDNTFLTAVLQKPLDLGADIVVYSTTKFIEGHNATVGGALVTNNAHIYEQCAAVRNTIGCIQSPFDAWLTLQGVKTLDIRLRKHCQNAQKVAEFLTSHNKVASVVYPGLDNFEQHELARRQQQGFGGLLTFTVSGGVAAGKKVMSAVKLCKLAENLGTVETLITHPASMTHAPIAKEQREKIGITDGLIRLSVGIEKLDDIIADLDQALANI